MRGAPLWWPAETDVSIRPGWFYHADEDSRVKSPDRLIRLYDESVGRGTNLNLNIPPDRRGRIADPDLASLKSFGDAMRATFATDLARGAVARASAQRGPRFAAGRVLDGDRETYWSTPDGDTTPSLTLDLPVGRTFDLVRLREYLPLGVRVTRFAVDAEVDGAWRTLAEEDCIGAQRLIRLAEPIAARRLRLRILSAPVCPAIGEIALFRQVAPAAVPVARNSDPDVLPVTGWSIAASSGGDARRLIDGDPATAWIVPAPTPANSASVTIAFAGMVTLAGFTLTPSRSVLTGAAPPRGYRAETSVDGTSWSPAATDEFPNIAYALSTQRIALAEPRPARFLRLSFDATAVPATRLAIAEIGAVVRGR